MHEEDPNLDNLFKELSEDPGIKEAAFAHEEACTTESCPICIFFDYIHKIRHLTDAFDPGKIARLADSTPGFLVDAMAVSQFLSACAQDYLEFLEFLEEDDEDEDEDE